VRGIRVQAGATTVDMLEPLSKCASDLGWDVQIHLLGDQIVGIEPLLNRALAVVFDHIGGAFRRTQAEHIPHT